MTFSKNMGEFEKKLKEDFSSQPEEFYKILTFGDLNVGDRYVSLPVPGDNGGHGGFRGTHYLFEKIEIVKNKFDISEDAKRLEDEILSFHPDNLPVVKVK